MFDYYRLTWDGATLTVMMMAEYDNDYKATIWQYLHERALGETTNLLILCLVQSYVIRPVCHRY